EAWAEIERARALTLAGYHNDEVQSALDRATHLFAQGSMKIGEAGAILALAEYWITRGNAERGRALAQSAAAIYAEKNMQANHLRACVVEANSILSLKQTAIASKAFAEALDEAQRLQLRHLEVRCRIGLGLCAIDEDDMKHARTWFESAVTLFEELRAALPGDDFREAFMADHLRPYEELLRIDLVAYARDAREQNAKSVFKRLERIRARTLNERLGVQQESRTSSVKTKEEHRLRTRLNWIYRQSQKLIEDGETASHFDIESKEIELQLLENARRKRVIAGGLGADLVGVFDPQAVQNKLETGDALIEYGVLDDELFVCVIRRDRVEVVHRMASWLNVVDAIQRVRFQIETMHYGTQSLSLHSSRLAERLTIAMKQLSGLVWAPLAHALGGCKRIIVVPHAILGTLQFAALFDGEILLGDQFDIAIAPSAQIALRGIERQPIGMKQVVAVGESSRLQHADLEAREIAHLFDQKEMLLNSEATVAAFVESSARADVLHVACHAQFRSDNPAFSALHLVDAPFSARDAEFLTLRQGIVTLSACETGSFQQSRGDEMIGLVRGFLIAGASRVLASLWPVDDAITRDFMKCFYGELILGKNAASALRSAQFAVRKKHLHPYYWGAFTLYAGW
ncbi:MAG: CHAT domain-containing protein, partial [Casimicrobium sp.]